MKFLLKRDRIKTRWKYGAGRTSRCTNHIGFLLNRYLRSVSSAKRDGGRRRERRESLGNVASCNARVARAITWRCSDCTATARCAGAFIMHVHPHISRWYTLKRREHTSTYTNIYIYTHQYPADFSSWRTQPRFVIIRKRACTMTRLHTYEREDCRYLFSKCLVIDSKFFNKK